MQFYERLKDLREDRDKTQTEIAELIGVGQGYRRASAGPDRDAEPEKNKILFLHF